MNTNKHTKSIARIITDYLTFFVLVAFVITCCMTLFISVMSYSLDIDLTKGNLNIAAKLTFGNVVFLSLLFTVFEKIRCNTEFAGEVADAVSFHAFPRLLNQH